MPTFKLSGYVTKDYDVELQPRAGIHVIEDIEYDIMKVAVGDGSEEPQKFVFNYVYVKDGKIFANATVTHWYEETAEGEDLDAAEDQFIEWGDNPGDANKNHKGKRMITIEEQEMVS